VAAPADGCFFVDCPAQVAAVQWVEIPQESAAQMQQRGLLPATGSYVSAAAWLKLFLPELLPLELPRVLYMDCDMMALSSLQPLLEP
jgi:lipopolysaccharide biosynthesis glycosyltransferase